MGFLLRFRSGKGPQPTVRGESPGCSRVSEWFLSSYEGNLKNPFVGLQGGSVSTRVAKGPSGLLCIRTGVEILFWR